MREARLLQIRASAGSGKTWQLTRRYMARLAELRPGPGAGAAARGILAITFTNAAANEMRERVIVRLKKAALGLARENMDAAAAAAWLDIFLEDSSALNIRTIDSLFHQIIRASALDLGINPAYQTIFDMKEALAPTVDMFIEQAASDENMRSMLRKACEPLVIAATRNTFVGGREILKQLNAVLELALAGRLEDLAGPSEARAVETEILKSIGKSASRLLDLAASSKCALKSHAAKALNACCAGNVPADSRFLSMENVSGLFSKDGVPDGAHAAYEELLAHIDACRFAHELGEQAGLWTACVSLAREVANQFLAEMPKTGLFPQVLAPIKARSVLSPLGPVSDAFCRMGCTLTHFLVDEFQDTSREQWDVLQALALEGASRGGSLLWVGDPKQSIYSWRGGNPALFEEALNDAGLNSVAGPAVSITLEDNWRSAGAIVEHNNRLFAPLADKSGAEQVISSMLASKTRKAVIQACAARTADAYKDTVQHCKSGSPGYVRVIGVEGDNTESLRQNALDRLCPLLLDEIGPRRRHNDGEIKWSDILILTRKNDFARQVAERLEDAGIPVLTENGLLLNENALILQTIAFLSFLDNPNDDIAFWAVINGCLLAGHPGAAALAHADLPALAAGRGNVRLFQIFRQAFPEVWRDYLAPFYNQAGILTAYDTIMEWHSRLNVAQRFPEDMAMLRRFMETAHMAENAGMASIAAFLDYWRDHSAKEKAPMPENMNAVRIMTIHKAKGLQAPVVIAPFTSFGIKAPDEPRIFNVFGHNMIARYRAPMQGVYQEEMGRQALEALNLLYVSLTRPVEELYIFNTFAKVSKSRTTSHGLRKLLELAGLDTEYSLGLRKAEARQPEETGKKLAANGFAAAVLTQDWLPMQWLPRLKIFRNHARTSILAANERGTLLHSALEYFFSAGSDIGEACRSALAAGERATGILASDTEREGLLQALAWQASIPQIRQWQATGLPEHSFMTAGKRMIRADLVVPGPGDPLVIDYKSGQPDAKYVTDMRGYLETLEQSGQFSGKPVGLLVYLDLRRFQMITPETVSPFTENIPDSLAIV